MDFKTFIVYFLAIIGGLIYLYGIYKACSASLKTPPQTADMPAFLSNIVTTIGAMLGTTFGATIGLPSAKGTHAFADLSANGYAGVRIAASVIYLITLLAAGIVWAIKKFDESQVIPIIPQLSKTLLGVIVGALAVVLANQA